MLSLRERPRHSHQVVELWLMRLHAAMTESTFLTELQKYEYIQFVIPDMNNGPRGKIISGKFKEKVAKNGFEVGNG